MTKKAGRAASPPRDSPPPDARLAARADIFGAAERIYLEHADAWFPILEAWWTLSRNPVFAWKALWLALHPSRSELVLPCWVRDYLFASSGNIQALVDTLPDKEALPIIAHALGFSADRRNFIHDANVLWNAPALYGSFLFYKANAPRKSRDQPLAAAAWSYQRVKEDWQLQHQRSAQVRIGEAKRAIAAVLRLQGSTGSTTEIEQHALEAYRYFSAAQQLAKMGATPAASELRGSFKIPPSRETALKDAEASNAEKVIRK